MILEDTRNDFMQSIYDMFSDDETNDRANQIIDIFDIATENCIELPCKVGETIFVLDNDNIQKRKVIGVEYLYFVDDTKHHYNIVVSDGCGHIDIKFNCVGRDVFLTKESAEQALRESENK